MNMDPLLVWETLEHSIWLDFLRRKAMAALHEKQAAATQELVRL